jgi:alpha-D-ribose 1-methylphosphonate 5-triphosphate synthase subunit PhnG
MSDQRPPGHLQRGLEPQSGTHPQPERRRWMAVLARAPADEIMALLGECGKLPSHSLLRGPEGGLVMVRGRAGGGGSAFNLGEMTVTRCSVRIATGQVGHSYIAGRDCRQAEPAARVDALMQDDDRRVVLEARVIGPLHRVQAERRDVRAGKAAATRVEFFAMQTMRT